MLTEVIKSCKSDKGVVTVNEESQKDKQFSLDSDSEEEDENAVGMDVDVNFIDEKSSAVHCLGNICLFCPSLIINRLPEILETLSDISFYFHENIRYHVCLTYTQIAFGLLKMFSPELYDANDKFQWKKGLPPVVTLADKVQEFIDTVIFPHFYKIFEDEQNKEVIEKTLECIRDFCEELGPCAIVNQTDRIVQVIISLLDKKAFCQTKAKDFKGEVGDGDGEEFEDEGQD